MSENILYDVTPFPPMILKAKYNWDNKNDAIKWCDNLVNSTNPKEGTHWATGTSIKDKVPHFSPTFKKFYEYLNKVAMDVIVNQYGYDGNMEFAIQNSWINLHIPGGSTSIHHHGPAVLSVAAYLHMPDNGGYIEFKDPLEYNKGYFPTPIDDEISNWKEVKTKTGDIVMFPGWLRHRTQENKSNENRWVVTTNYICTNKPKQK